MFGEFVSTWKSGAFVAWIASAAIAPALALQLPTVHARAAPQRSAAGPTLAPVDCAAAWRPSFGTAPGVSGRIEAQCVFDDGHGPALFVGGSFSDANGRAASNVARWDGASWAALGAGVDGTVLALCVFDDGHGAALYAGGTFETAGGIPAPRIARWNGVAWSALASGLDGGTAPSVSALAVFDDGAGPALHAAGAFTFAGGASVSNIARWDGTSWSSLGAGTDLPVDDLIVHDDGGGARLFACGAFTQAGGVLAAHIAKWSGASWSALGGGTDAPSDALAVFDDGSGAALYVGGRFTHAGGVSANRIAKWDGASWSALGAGIGGASEPVVLALSTFDDGSGRALHVAGVFGTAGGAPIANVARWDGYAWTGLASGTDPDVRSLVEWNDGAGTALFAGGSFRSADGKAASGFASWDGSSWRTTGTGFNGTIQSFAVFDDGSGAALFAAGEFTSASGSPAVAVARWNGSVWTSTGTGMRRANALAVFDDGAGAALYAAGDLVGPGGIGTHGVARWTGTSWSVLGSGTNSAASAGVFGLAVFDDGTGAALYAGGRFTSMGGVAMHQIARWDGSGWSGLSNGITGPVLGLPLPYVRALCVFDDGTGAALYAGGQFTNAGGVVTGSIARWDGTNWSLLGSGVDGEVRALRVFGAGNAARLYAGGQFTLAGGVAAANIARWDGTNWSSVGAGVGGASAAVVEALTVFDRGAGAALHAGGRFTSAGGVSARNIAAWNGVRWSALAEGVGAQDADELEALLEFDDGNGPALFAGGTFRGSASSSDAYAAKWACVTPGASAPFCAGDASSGACPCGNNGAAGHGCANSAFAGGALLASSGNASVSADTLALHASGLTGALAIFFQGATQAPALAIDDGLGCVGGAIVRLGTKLVSASSARYPLATDPSISVRGLLPATGGTRYYQCFYRNAVAAFCPPATSNRTNGVLAIWSP